MSELEPYRAIVREETTRIAKESGAPEPIYTAEQFDRFADTVRIQLQPRWERFVQQLSEAFEALQRLVVQNPKFFGQRQVRVARRTMRRRKSNVPGARPEHRAMHAEYHRRSKKRKGKK